MLNVPAGNEERVIEAVPPLNVAVPIFVGPLKKSTVPVAAAGTTVAVIVTLLFKQDGLGLRETVVLVAV